jgi:hypothetical protein
MRKLRLAIVILCLLATASVSLAQSGQVEPARKHDEFSGLQCEDLMAHLDNYAIALQVEPKLQAHIVSYGGSQGRSEAQRWAVAAKKYLTSNRGIEAKRIVMLYGGRRKLRAMELWLLPDGYSPSAAGPQTTQPKGVRFKTRRIKRGPCVSFF